LSFLPTSPRRVIAIDWSGAGADGSKRQPGIWVASWSENGGGDLFGALSREEVSFWLCVEAKRDPGLVVGFDFSFSFPAWFVRKHGGSARAIWKATAEHGEQWLREAAYPFWRNARPVYPENEPEYRVTERAQPGHPSSTFKLVGDGHVGTGSVRGMPCLARLRKAGFSVWPFDEAAFPLAIEIYPSACYPRRTRAAAAARAAFLAGTFFSPEQIALAERSPDAFDAAAALVAMVRHRESFARLPAARNATERIEGRIWTPPDR
jgi:hypothetical protein